MRVGDRIHGFAGGYFGRDSYHCREVEHIGPDWVITRTEGDSWEAISLRDAKLAHALYGERERAAYDDGEWCCNDD